MNEEQQVAYVGLPLGFAQRVKVRELRFLVGRAHAATISCWYAQMYDQAKHGTAFGVFTTSIRSFVDAYGEHVPHESEEMFAGWFSFQQQLWRAFEQVGLIHIEGSLDVMFRVTVLDFHETNTPRPFRRKLTDDEKRERDRLRKRESRSKNGKHDSPANTEERPILSTVSMDSPLSALQDKQDKQDKQALPLAPTSARGATIEQKHWSVDKLEAQEIATVRDRIADKLEPIVDGGRPFADHVAMQLIEVKAPRPHHQTKRKYDLVVWERAVDAFVARVNDPDKEPVAGDPVGYIINMVPGHELEPVRVKSGAPRPGGTVTVDDLAAHKQRVAEWRASQQGGAA